MGANGGTETVVETTSHLVSDALGASVRPKASQELRTRPMEAPTMSKRLTALDRLLIGYTALLAVFIGLNASTMRRPVELLVAHAAIIAFIYLLPARGAAWEFRTAREGLARFVIRHALRFLRYMYPLGLVIFYFEEVSYFVNSLWTDAPFWFEPYLFAADRTIFGGDPSVLVNPYVGIPQDEIMHFFYFSYYLIILGGGAFAYVGFPFTKRLAGPGFTMAITSVTASFLFAFVWYPYLPARGPWETPELMEGLTAFKGIVFVPWIETIIAHGAVSGACFPSGHVAGAFGMTFGLMRYYPIAGRVSLFLATGMAVACVYTRYHHSLDIVAGLACAGLGYAFARYVTSQNMEPPLRT